MYHFIYGYIFIKNKVEPCNEDKLPLQKILLK